MSTTSSAPLLTALEQIATQLTAARPHDGASHTDQLLQRLTRAAVTSVPGTDHAGLTLYSSDGNLTSRAPSDDQIAEIDTLQVTLGEGPCLEAITPGTARRVEVLDFTTDSRWPRFGPTAAQHGMRSLLSFAMAPHDDRPHAALNLYSHQPDAFDAQAREVATAFATHAAVAIYGAETVAHLERALDTRDLIGQAKGILMQTHRIDSDRAFELLAHYSQQTNTKLYDVAQRLIAATADTPPPSRPDSRRLS